MTVGARPAAVQGALFDAASPRRKRRDLLDEIVPREWPGGIKPWDPIDQADTQLGWEHTFVSPRRAVEIRHAIAAGRA